jgi:hypothetical protein
MDAHMTQQTDPKQPKPDPKRCIRCGCMHPININQDCTPVGGELPCGN